MKRIQLKGITASLGAAQGKTVHMKSLKDIKKVKKGNIIVTDKITSEYTEAFMLASGVISCKGGITCHAAILCREFKKPCITACVDAFSVVEEGVSIVMDAKKREILISQS